MIPKNLNGMKEIGCKEEKTFHLEIIMRLSNKLINHENMFILACTKASEFKPFKL